MNNNYDANAEETTNLQVDKQSILNNVALKKEELQRQLYTLSTCMEDIIKKHKTVVSQLYQNFNELWDKYQNKIIDLDKNKRYKECLNIIVDDLYKMYETFKCHLKEQYEENKYLEDKFYKLEKQLNEEKKNIICLIDQNQKYIKCLEQKSEELTKITQKLMEKTDELNNKKKENRNLKSKLDDYIQKVDKFKLEEFQQIKNIDIFKTKIEIEIARNKEFNQIICEQRNQKQELVEALKRGNMKIERLKQTIEKENIEAKCSINKLRKKNLNVDKEKEDLNKEIKETKDESEKRFYENELKKSQIKELQCKLDTALENSDEKKKLKMEKIEKIHGDIKKSITDINTKNSYIIELEEQLLDIKKRYKTKVEMAHNFKIQLDNLKHNQYLLPMMCEDSKDSIIAYHNDNSLTKFSQKNDKIKTNCNFKYVFNTFLSMIF